ncbi:hypothetical protein TMM008_26910 [Pseudomonas sp. 008]|nr:hypothetical protein TMM008_26910 [Pseudomonas sp. 008]
MLHHIENGGVRNRQDDNIPSQGGAVSACRGTCSDLLGQRPHLGGVTTHHLDGGSGFGGKAADRYGHVT